MGKAGKVGQNDKTLRARTKNEDRKHAAKDYNLAGCTIAFQKATDQVSEFVPHPWPRRICRLKY